nr:MAG TPA: hypothetical protein [Caudoviricetes sp.]
MLVNYLIVILLMFNLIVVVLLTRLCIEHFASLTIQF